jgi:Potassium-transporting ATPase A subunit
MGTSAGVTPAMLDSYTPVGGASALGPILLGEVSPGGVGTGLTGMLIFSIVAVFVGGLMVGRTPEFLGKTVRGGEMKLAVLYLLVVPVVVLGGAAASVLLKTARASALNPGPHGFAEILYAYAANGKGPPSPASTPAPTGTTSLSASPCSAAVSCCRTWLRTSAGSPWSTRGAGRGRAADAELGVRRRRSGSPSPAR